jgi:hypothetical protein
MRERSCAIFFYQRIYGAEIAKKLFTADEFFRMGEAGIFDRDVHLG